MATTEPLTKGVTLIPSDCLDVLASLPDNSVDSCVTDPPYHLTSGNLAVDWGTMGPNGTKRPNIKPTNASGRGHKTGFMGKAWDGGDIAFRPEIWAQVLRVLKPGAHLLSFGGTRTYHRMACAIEDAGFEIRDCVQWIYGSGFPKSLDVSKGIDKAAGAEREVLGVGPFAARRVNPNGGRTTGTFEHDGHELTAPTTDAARQWEGWGTALKPACEPIVVARKPLSESTVAANVLKWGTGALNIDGGRVDAGTDHVANCDRTFQSGIWKKSGEAPAEITTAAHSLGRWPANVIHDGSDEVVGAFPESESTAGMRGLTGRHDPGQGANHNRIKDYSNSLRGHTDSGSAARFFYTAKADSDDRLGSKHPTVKPVDLIQYLVRLVTPPRGIVLDCFAGTGTTGEACIREKLRCILIERETEYCDDIRRRMRLAMAGPDERVRESAKVRNPNPDLGPLFQDYDAQKDLAGSIADGFAAIRERKAAGGQGWGE